MKKEVSFFKHLLLATVATPLVLSATLPQLAYANGPQCAPLFIESDTAPIKLLKEPKKDLVTNLRESIEANYKERNAILAKRYPQLDFVFKDPEAFVAVMKSRFEQQKTITPEDPRLFNFPEAAPTMKEIRADLEKFRTDLVS